ncbi:MAG: DUF192 domain-containing protein [Minisyncoccia bacterium]
MATFKIILLLFSILLLFASVYLLIIFLGGAKGSSNYLKCKIVLGSQEFNVDVADTMIKQMQGLSIYQNINNNEGMLFVFPNKNIRTFWMKGMKFPIDIIWIDDNKIIGFEKNVQPEPGVIDNLLKIYSSPAPVDKVLELKAGTIDNLNLTMGSQINILQQCLK